MPSPPPSSPYLRRRRISSITARSDRTRSCSSVDSEGIPVVCKECSHIQDFCTCSEPAASKFSLISVIPTFIAHSFASHVLSILYFLPALGCRIRRVFSFAVVLFTTSQRVGVMITRLLLFVFTLFPLWILLLYRYLIASTVRRGVVYGPRTRNTADVFLPPDADQLMRARERRLARWSLSLDSVRAMLASGCVSRVELMGGADAHPGAVCDGMCVGAWEEANASGAAAQDDLACACGGSAFVWRGLGCRVHAYCLARRAEGPCELCVGVEQHAHAHTRACAADDEDDEGDDGGGGGGGAVGDVYVSAWTASLPAIIEASEHAGEHTPRAEASADTGAAAGVQVGAAETHPGGLLSSLPMPTAALAPPTDAHTHTHTHTHAQACMQLPRARAACSYTFPCCAAPAPSRVCPCCLLVLAQSPDGDAAQSLLLPVRVYREEWCAWSRWRDQQAGSDDVAAAVSRGGDSDGAEVEVEGALPSSEVLCGACGLLWPSESNNHARAPIRARHHTHTHTHAHANRGPCVECDDNVTPNAESAHPVPPAPPSAAHPSPAAADTLSLSALPPLPLPPVPCLVFVCGGAWTIGFRMWGALMAAALARPAQKLSARGRMAQLLWRVLKATGLAHVWCGPAAANDHAQDASAAQAGYESAKATGSSGIGAAAEGNNHGMGASLAWAEGQLRALWSSAWHWDAPCSPRPPAYSGAMCVVCVDYRNYPLARLGDMQRDVGCAVRWTLRQRHLWGAGAPHCESLVATAGLAANGIDVSARADASSVVASVPPALLRGIGLGGQSAGAHIVISAALHAWSRTTATPPATYTHVPAHAHAHAPSRSWLSHVSWLWLLAGPADMASTLREFDQRGLPAAILADIVGGTERVPAPATAQAAARECSPADLHALGYPLAAPPLLQPHEWAAVRMQSPLHMVVELAHPHADALCGLGAVAREQDVPASAHPPGTPTPTFTSTFTSTHTQPPPLRPAPCAAVAALAALPPPPAPAASHTDLLSFPPVTILHGDCDRTVQFSAAVALATAMHTRGARVALVLLRGGTHTDVLLELPAAGRDPLAALVRFAAGAWATPHMHAQVQAEALARTGADKPAASISATEPGVAPPSDSDDTHPAGSPTTTATDACAMQAGAEGLCVGVGDRFVCSRGGALLRGAAAGCEDASEAAVIDEAAACGPEAATEPLIARTLFSDEEWAAAAGADAQVDMGTGVGLGVDTASAVSCPSAASPTTANAAIVSPLISPNPRPHTPALLLSPPPPSPPRALPSAAYPCPCAPAPCRCLRLPHSLPTLLVSAEPEHTLPLGPPLIPVSLYALAKRLNPF